MEGVWLNNFKRPGQDGTYIYVRHQPLNLLRSMLTAEAVIIFHLAISLCFI
jgi:hypothetical protein